MRSELTEVALIDQYLFGRLSPGEALAFEADLLVDPVLAGNVEAQRSAHGLIRSYARREERQRLKRVFQQLLAEPVFAHQIQNIFG